MLADGDVNTSTTIAPGYNGGYGYEFPQIPLQTAQAGGTGVVPLGFYDGARKDDRILITGVSLTGFFILPAKLSDSHVLISMGTSKDSVNMQNQFLIPDGVDNLNLRNPQAKRERKIYWTKKHVLNHKKNQTVMNYDSTTNRWYGIERPDTRVQVKHYFNFATKPIVIKYKTLASGEYDPAGTAWDGRRLFFMFKCANSTRDSIQFVGNIITYYKDF